MPTEHIVNVREYEYKITVEHLDGSKNHFTKAVQVPESKHPEHDRDDADDILTDPFDRALMNGLIKAYEYKLIDSH